MTSLIYVHIGKELPECFLDNIYQTILTNYKQIKIYILLNDELIAKTRESVNKLNTCYFNDDGSSLDLQFVYIKNSVIENHLQNNENYNNYCDSLKKYNDIMNFRDGFWVSTTKRFFYIHAVMEMFCIENVFHIENDVLLNENLNELYGSIINKNKIYMVKDSIDRVIPSILFIPNANEMLQLVKYISDTMKGSDSFMNDMNLLGVYPNFKSFNAYPNNQHKYLYDGAAIGQYLDGIDVKNLNGLPEDKESQQYKLIQFNNPTVGFINETSLYKPNKSVFYKKQFYVTGLTIPINILLCKTNENTNMIPNIHIHSKQLYKFSSVFDLKINDIISGDRVVGVCDFVISTHEINDFHKNLEHFIPIDRIVLIKNLLNINYAMLNKYMLHYLKKNNKKSIKLFIYTHLFEKLFKIGFFDNIDTSIDYDIYLHNSDHSFDNNYLPLLDKKHIKKVYVQNPNIDLNEKVTLLPIGIANSMWVHGDLIGLYDTMKSTYLYKKCKSVYININPNTFGYRLDVLNKLKEYEWELSQSKPYKEYLYELSQHYFCLCIRGNGIDTHRFWEALYLGVIPIIINNEETNCQNFINYLREMEIPFYEIKNLDVFTNKDFFNEKLYKRQLLKLKKSIGNLNTLKISHYIN